MIKEGTLVFPGQKIASSEELLSGYGTFDVEGDIVGGIIGKFFVDRKKMSAEVKPLTSVPSLVETGDIVLCEVIRVSNTMVLVQILHIAGSQRPITGERFSIIHVSNIDKQYVDHPGDKFRKGDIARAKVIQAKPSLKLSTEGPELGVIKSFCVRCRHSLSQQNSRLECPVCGNIESRKTASDYGQGNLDKK